MNAPVLTLHDLGTRRGAVALTRMLNLEVAPGELWAVLGPNGCGKSTLLLTLAGLLAPASGRVSLGGRNLHTLRDAARARLVGLLPQDGATDFHGTVASFAALGRLPHRDTASGLVAAALDALALGGLAARRCEHLSGGELQRARIAQLLAQDTPLMLLDEPFAHLDLAHQARVMATLETRAAAGAALLLTLHDQFWAARRCTHVLLLDAHGGWQAGTPAQLLAPGTLSRLYGCALDDRLAPSRDETVARV